MLDIFAKSIEYINGVCIVDGVAQPNSDQCANVAKWFMAFFIPFIIAFIVLFIWWIFTLVHVIKHEDVPNRIVWLILHFVGLGIMCAPVYYFAVQRPYKKKQSGSTGSGSNASSASSTPTTPQDSKQSPDS